MAELQTPVKRVRTPFRYRIGLIVVGVAMVLLPVLYVALIAIVALMVLAHATTNTGLLTVGPHHPRVIFLSIALYLAPIIGGLITIFFMFKPLLARPGHARADLELEPRQQPLIFQVVAALARAIGAPVPVSIEVNCDANAAASFRPGLWSFLRRKLVLTIGMPLVGAMDTRLFVVTLAHELGHFTQGGAMRMSSLIRRTNAWFGRVALERDRWDEWLDEAGGGDTNVIVNLGVVVTRGLVWLSRQVLIAMMHLGHLISSVMLRQMERDADRRAARVAGADAFVNNLVRLHELSFASRLALEEVDDRLSGHDLPDDLPGLVCARARNLPLEVRRRVQALTLQSQTHWFDSHPAPRERIAVVRKENAPGIVRTSVPAAELFADFPRLCKRVTRFEYEHGFGLDPRELRLVPVRELPVEPPKGGEAPVEVERYFGYLPIPLLGPVVSRETVRPQDTAGAARDRMLSARTTMRRQATPASESIAAVGVTLNRYLSNLSAAVMADSGFTLDGQSFGLSRTDRASVDEAVRKAQASLAEQVEALTPSRELAAVRLSAALQLLQNPHVQARLRSSGDLAAQVERVVPLAERTNELWEPWLELVGAKARLEILLHHMDRLGVAGPAGLTHRTSSNLLRWARTTCESLDRLRVATQGISHPFSGIEPRPSVAEVLLPRRPDADNPTAVLGAASAASGGLVELFARTLETMVAAALQVEALIDEAIEANGARPSSRPTTH